MKTVYCKGHGQRQRCHTYRSSKWQNRTLKVILSNGGLVNARNQNGNTALHMATEYGMECCKAVKGQHRY